MLAKAKSVTATKMKTKTEVPQTLGSGVLAPSPPAFDLMTMNLWIYSQEQLPVSRVSNTLCPLLTT